MRTHFVSNAKTPQQNKRELIYKISEQIYLDIFESYFISQFIRGELVTDLYEVACLDCSDEFLRLIAKDYFND